jgi:hypothetical protein
MPSQNFVILYKFPQGKMLSQNSQKLLPFETNSEYGLFLPLAMASSRGSFSKLKAASLTLCPRPVGEPRHLNKLNKLACRARPAELSFRYNSHIRARTTMLFRLEVSAIYQ